MPHRWRGTAVARGRRQMPPAQQKSDERLDAAADAADTKNPLTVDDKVLAIGKKVFNDKCQKCHGPKGLGDGPDADPDHAEDMNLTNPEARRTQSRRRGVLQGDERPPQPEDAGVQGRAVEGADLVGRRLRAVAAQEVESGDATVPRRDSLPEPLQVDVVGVGAIQLGADVDEHHRSLRCGPGRARRARCSSSSS